MINLLQNSIQSEIFIFEVSELQEILKEVGKTKFKKILKILKENIHKGHLLYKGFDVVVRGAAAVDRWPLDE